MIGLLARHHGDVPQISVETLHRQVFELELGRLWVAAEEEGLIGYATVSYTHLDEYKRQE